VRGLDARTTEALDRRLLPASDHPIAVALSGGGDSLALTLIADAWARSRGRRLLILTVDHRLQAHSARWTEACAGVARRLGHDFQALPWTGEKPATGLPAAARTARHRLLADAARAAGARVILMGHTADDRIEAAAMRAAGATTPDPREWSPSPVWPQGRELFLLRPLLEVRRTAIRDWLTARGERWIDDPANLDPRYARTRARQLGGEEPTESARLPALDLPFTERLGVIATPRAALRAASEETARRFTALACVCAGGGDRLPQAARVARLAAALQGSDTIAASLAGARAEADAAEVRLFREPGEAARGGLAAEPLTAGVEMVWDGRFVLGVERPGSEVRRLAGLAQRLSPEDRRRLHDVPPAARGALPALVDGDTVTLAAGARSLVGDRFRAAAGLVTLEPA